MKTPGSGKKPKIVKWILSSLRHNLSNTRSECTQRNGQSLERSLSSLRHIQHGFLLCKASRTGAWCCWIQTSQSRLDRFHASQKRATSYLNQIIKPNYNSQLLFPLLCLCCATVIWLIAGLVPSIRFLCGWWFLFDSSFELLLKVN